MNPFFTIIIPTYNRATKLPNAIQSVLEQTYTDFELIIIDDGSTDGTKEAVSGFKDERIRYVYQENAELSAARNRGVNEARGTYICFLDDDDIYLENHLVVLHDEIVSRNNPKEMYRTGLITRRGEQETPGILYGKNEHRLQFMWTHFVGNTTFCFPKEVFLQDQFSTQFLLFEDKHFLARVLLKYDLVQIHAHTVIYNYNEDSRSITAYRDADRLKNQSACLEDLFSTHGEELKNILGKHAKRRKRAVFDLQAAYQALRNKDWQYSKKHFRSAIAQYSKVDMMKSYFAFIVRYIMKKVVSIYSR
jgi:glycosyltransferase involved in cell wall biosynthesis